MGIETAAVLGSAAVGQGLGLWQQSKDRSAAKKLANQNRNQAFGMMQNDPGAAESGLLNFLPYIGGNQALNSGQDAFMQYLRADPARQNDFISQTFQGIAGQQDPFAPGGAYSALNAADQRAAATQVAGLRGSAGSLGQRFGSQLAGAEAQLRGTIADNTAARNAQLAQSFLNTRIGAAQAASERQLGLGQQYLGAAGQLAGIGQGQIGALLAALQGAGQLGAQRNQYNLGLFGVGAGQQLPPSLGGQIGDTATGLAGLYYLMNGNKTSAAPGTTLPTIPNQYIYPGLPGY